MFARTSLPGEILNVSRSPFPTKVLLDPVFRRKEWGPEPLMETWTTRYPRSVARSCVTVWAQENTGRKRHTAHGKVVAKGFDRIGASMECGRACADGTWKSWQSGYAFMRLS
jgi:hypothetical protein